jgi:hypothetical protein
MVIARVPEAELDRVAQQRYAKAFPFGGGRYSWDVVRGTDGWSGLISRLPGSEGSDWTIAEIISRSLGNEPVYSLWFDPERSSIVEWRRGRRAGERSGSPDDLARSYGFDVGPPVEAWRRPPTRGVAVVEDTPVEVVRRGFGRQADEPWLHIEVGRIGTVLHTTDGDVGMEAWDLSKALPDATIYLVEHELDSGGFSVVLLKAGAMTASFRIPESDGDLTVPEIKGVRTPSAILSVLGIAPTLLGYEDEPAT